MGYTPLPQARKTPPERKHSLLFAVPAAGTPVRIRPQQQYRQKVARAEEPVTEEKLAYRHTSSVFPEYKKNPAPVARCRTRFSSEDEETFHPQIYLILTRRSTPYFHPLSKIVNALARSLAFAVSRKYFYHYGKSVKK